MSKKEIVGLGAFVMLIGLVIILILGFVFGKYQEAVLLGVFIAFLGLATQHIKVSNEKQE